MTDQELERLYRDMCDALADRVPDFELAAVDAYEVGEPEHAVVCGLMEAAAWDVPIPPDLLERARPLFEDDEFTRLVRRAGPNAA